MEKEILTKVSRYITLSKKFQKSENDLFNNTNVNSNKLITVNNTPMTFSVSNSSEASVFSVNDKTIFINNREICIMENGVLRAMDKQPITRAEKLLAQAKFDAIFADEYDEYIKLQSDLTEYFKSFENLTK